MSGMVMNHGAEVCESNVVIRVLPESWAEKDVFLFEWKPQRNRKRQLQRRDDAYRSFKLELLELEFKPP